MANQIRASSHSLTEQLYDNPETFNFFQALRLVECSRPELPRIGTSRGVAADPLRFSQFLSMAFASSTLAQGQSPTARRKLAIRFTGLTGPHGPLPIRLTEFLWNRLKGNYDIDLRGTKADTSEKYGYTSPKDSSALDFLDIFHHRIISLFYRAWSVCQKTVDLDREDGQSFSHWIASLAGLGLPECDGMDSLPTEHRLPFTGHLGCQTRHTDGLKSMLSAYFRTPVKIENCVGQWVHLPDDQTWKLGLDPATGSLGKTCIVGAKIWDCQLKFRAILGPVSFSVFQTFLKGAQGHSRIHDSINFYVRQELYWEAVIVLRKEEIPATVLGSAGQLGHSCWVKSQAPTKDSTDYRIRGGGLTASENS